MANVSLLSLTPNNESHWANPVGILKRCYGKSSSPHHLLIEKVEEADVILLCDTTINTNFPSDHLFNPIVRQNYSKIIRYSQADSDFHWLRGIYTSLERSRHECSSLLGGIYLHVSERFPRKPFDITENLPYLFSFFGNSRTHSVRRHILQLCTLRSRLCDTGDHPGNFSGKSQNVYKEFYSQYLDSLRDSKFILCPRGKCPSSIRVFEAMKAGRVPVIISDEWVPPKGPRWEEFCIFIPESDITFIPEILKNKEPEFPELARRAQREWSKWFSEDHVWDTVIDWALNILNSGRRVPISILIRDFIRWRTWRHGIFSEFNRLIMQHVPIQ